MRRCRESTTKLSGIGASWTALGAPLGATGGELADGLYGGMINAALFRSLDAARVDEAVRQIVERFAPVAVYLYGSHARGDARPDSDVDLAFLTDGPALAALDLWNVRQDLAALFGAPVDLVHLDTASTVLQREVVTDGLRLYAADPYSADLFELAALREYADLMKRREGLDADIAARGRVLGFG